MINYVKFLFDESLKVKPRYQPILAFQPKNEVFILKYSIPGYHSPRQYFKFFEIPQQFPNPYVEAIFKLFLINDSILFRRPRNLKLKPKLAAVRKALGLPRQIHIVSPEEKEIAQHNMDLALKLGREKHSLFYFDFYLEAYKSIHPEIRFTQKQISLLQKFFNKAIS